MAKGINLKMAAKKLQNAQNATFFFKLYWQKCNNSLVARRETGTENAYANLQRVPSLL